jgi:hypothetical protein
MAATKKARKSDAAQRTAPDVVRWDKATHPVIKARLIKSPGPAIAALTPE